MWKLLTTLLLGLLFISTAQAQFQFFEQMFGGGGGGGGQQRHHHEDQRDIPSDSSWYQRTADGAQCSKYLCPGTLACVDVPLHCPCAYPQVEEKFEFGEGSAMCISKGGYKAGEAARKVELARKGLI